MGRKYVHGVLSLFLGLSAAFLLAEGIVRILGISSELVYYPNAFFGWSHTPNDHFKRGSKGSEVQITINSLGLRDYEYAYDKPSGVFRILVLGDSFSEAFQVPLERSFTKGVEDRLQKVNAHNINGVQVINAGTSGYGTDNELLFFRHEGYKYNPDLVVLAFYIGNDVRNNWYKLENVDVGGVRKPYFVLRPDGLELVAYPFTEADSLFTQVKLYLNRHLRLYTLSRRIRDRLRYTKTVTQSGIPLDINLFAETNAKEWDQAWKMTEALLLELDQEVRRHKANLFVVLIPTQFQVNPSYWRDYVSKYAQMREMKWDLEKPNRKLGEFLNRHAIKYIDLLPEFRAKAMSTSSEFYLRSDGHWSIEGHWLASMLISESLLSQGVIRRN